MSPDTRKELEQIAREARGKIDIIQDYNLRQIGLGAPGERRGDIYEKLQHWIEIRDGAERLLRTPPTLNLSIVLDKQKHTV